MGLCACSAFAAIVANKRRKARAQCLVRDVTARQLAVAPRAQSLVMMHNLPCQLHQHACSWQMSYRLQLAGPQQVPPIPTLSVKGWSRRSWPDADTERYRVPVICLAGHARMLASDRRILTGQHEEGSQARSLQPSHTSEAGLEEFD